MDEFERNGTTEYDEMGFQNRFKNETFCLLIEQNDTFIKDNKTH